MSAQWIWYPRSVCPLDLARPPRVPIRYAHAPYRIGLYPTKQPLDHSKVSCTLYSWQLLFLEHRTGVLQFSRAFRHFQISRVTVNHGEHSTPNATKRTYKRIPLSAKKRIVDAFNNAMDWKRVAQAKGVNISSARNWLHLDSLTSKQRGGNKYHDS
ncbi:hypothetical protein AaE_012259 [Aphanomyces astaci]|uniref:Uncharacterized protein n=1 Tax=Aphanomyces astaci TaxID=112090 RepID=A0A6A4ZSC4_APHAT|nr:hypothetical protein AaE_012259 [Aphanomyces astaci]